MYQRILRTTCTRCIHNRDRPAVKRNKAELRIELQTFRGLLYGLRNIVLWFTIDETRNPKTKLSKLNNHRKISKPLIHHDQNFLCRLSARMKLTLPVPLKITSTNL